MKKNILILLLIVSRFLYAQTTLQDKLYKDAIGHIYGINKTYDPELAKKILYDLSLNGYAKAMTALGSLYNSKFGTKKNSDSAIIWYEKATNAGEPTACYYLGNIFKEGRLVEQDFVKALECYEKGIPNNIGCLSMAGYMYFKGLGCNQSYKNAYFYFKQAAERGESNAMYFLGLSYRNGYGVEVDTSKAQYWLLKALEKGKANIEYEINANRENQDQKYCNLVGDIEKQLKRYDNFIAKDIAGKYQGYAVYKDWSRKHISDVQPLQLILSKTENNQFEATWYESDKQNIPILIQRTTGNQFALSQKSKYNRLDHYSGPTQEPWTFKSANLSLAFSEDNYWLTGDINFYSEERREPGKPVSIYLQKDPVDFPLENETISLFRVFPNPTHNNSYLSFSLKQSCKVSIDVITANGKTISVEYSRTLPSGTYNYEILTGNFPAGIYIVMLKIENGETMSAKLIKH